MSNQLQITTDNKGTGFETVHDTKFNRARDAIMKFLKDNNTSLIDQAEWAKLKKWNDMAGDGPGDGWLVNHDRDVDNKDVELGKNKYGPPPKRADQSGQANIDSGGVNPALSANAEIQTGADQDLTPTFSQSSQTGNVFSITQDNSGWWITKTEPNGQTKKFKGPYKTDKEANKLAIGFANSTNSEYKPYEAPANSVINAPVPQSNAEDEKMKLQVKAATNKAIQAMIAAGKDNAVGRQKIFNDFEKQGWLEQLEFYKDDKDMRVLHSKFEGVKAGVPQWWMTDAEMQQQLGQQNNRSANNGEHLPAGVDNKEIEKIRNLAGVPSQTEPKPPATPTASDTKQDGQQTTGNAGAPAEKDPLKQEPNPASIEDIPSTGDVPERYKIQQTTDPNGKTQWEIIDSKNALTPVETVGTKDEAIKVANAKNNQAAKKSNGQQQIDQQHTDFTRLLKNAGLLKEFY